MKNFFFVVLIVLTGFNNIAKAEVIPVDLHKNVFGTNMLSFTSILTKKTYNKNEFNEMSEYFEKACSVLTEEFRVKPEKTESSKYHYITCDWKGLGVSLRSKDEGDFSVPALYFNINKTGLYPRFNSDSSYNYVKALFSKKIINDTLMNKGDEEDKQSNVLTLELSNDTYGEIRILNPKMKKGFRELYEPISFIVSMYSEFSTNNQSQQSSIQNRSNALAGANDLCKQAVYMAGGDGGFVIGYCGSSSESSAYWQCMINAISSSGKRGRSNDDVSSVIGFASGFGSCYGK